MPSIGRAVGAFSFAATIALTTLLGSPGAIAARSSLNTTGGLLSGAVGLTSPFINAFNKIANTQGLSEGSDGRLTILLLGSDTRKHSVSRTDTIMLMSLKNGVLSAASIPRDMARIPNPNGGTFKPRVNAILKQLVRQSGGNVEAGMQKFDSVIEYVTGAEIDYHALITFAGFDDLVGVVDPIYVNNTQNIRDPKFQDDPNKPRGVYFPPSAGYMLEALHLGPLCNGLWKTAANPAQYACHRALPFVRSRKGPSNSDFQRAHRQQNFVAAVAQQIASGELNPLVDAANKNVGNRDLWTNIPINSSTAFDLYGQLGSATLSSTNQVVFAPSTYATHIPGTTAYQLNLGAVRSWISAHMS
jgi:anionic cell wall polymer biosynthesis LytR-Cps2A-Psr (LCP) family protein